MCWLCQTKIFFYAIVVWLICSVYFQPISADPDHSISDVATASNTIDLDNSTSDVVTGTDAIDVGVQNSDQVSFYNLS